MKNWQKPPVRQTWKAHETSKRGTFGVFRRNKILKVKDWTHVQDAQRTSKSKGKLLSLLSLSNLLAKVIAKLWGSKPVLPVVQMLKIFWYFL